MTRRWLLVVVLLATAAWTGTAVAWFHDYFPAGADGSMNTYPDEGYAVSGDGNYRLAKRDDHIAYYDFVTEKSDGPDRLREGFTGDAADGVLLTSWITGKKVFNAYVYIRDASNEFCNASLPVGTYLPEPVRVMGFRAGNSGAFNDRGWAIDTDPASPTYEQWVPASAGGGCCASYNNALLLPGENGPPAWRMGQGPYTAKGDIGTAVAIPSVTTAEYWKVSAKDSVVANRNKFLQAGSLPFDPDGDGLGGWSGPVNGTETVQQDNQWGFEWLIRYSDAHVINAATLDGADCTPSFGGSEPRDIAGDFTGALGWYAVPLDRAVVLAMGVPTDGCKGLTFDCIDSTVDMNPLFYGRDQGGDHNAAFSAYLDLRATYNGDCRLPLDGKVNVFDLNTLAAAWNTTKGVHPNYNVECDFNLDGKINVFDLNLMAANWNKTVPNEP